MKLFSRKALLAVATATAVTTGAMTAPPPLAAGDAVDVRPPFAGG